MATIVKEVQHRKRRHRRSKRTNQRKDIQGLRMVAMVMILIFHLCGWPKGGFAMVDVFFVVSGFLITGNLLRMAESRGNVSFKQFYWNRVRRIIPAATVVLVLTYVVALLLFQPFRAHEVGIDALFAFIFMSNWWFAAQRTDYFAAADSASPIQHYWTLSVEEQFYFVWPALVFVIGLIVAHKAWNHGRRMKLAGVVMAGVIAISLGWSLYETATAPTQAYFGTFARVWELGAGALLATVVGVLARIPVSVKAWMSWAGLGLIGLSLVLISETSIGFPAPWALLPVSGSALVIAAGVQGEPNVWLLRNRASVYVGNISYSLYLVHWPIIIFLAVLMPHDTYFYLAAVALTFGLAVASYHFVEDPLRHADWSKGRATLHEIKRRRFRPQQSTRYAAVAALALLSVGLTAYAIRPVTSAIEIPQPVAAVSSDRTTEPTEKPLGPLGAELRQQITTALSATQWPHLEPSMESGMRERWPDEVILCSLPTPPTQEDCTWGSPSAPTRIVIVGDSVAMHYANAMRQLAENSDGQVQVHVEAMGGCPFANDTVFTADQQFIDACPARKQHAVDYINTNKPTVVFVSNMYGGYRRVGVEQAMSQDEWFASVSEMVDKVKASAGKLVWLAGPPEDKNIKECYGRRSSVPADCISRITNQWLSMAATERRLAETFGGAWIDSRPWFCSADGLCPSFVGSTPTKHDVVHSTRAYEERIYPVMDETFKAAGVY